MNYCNRHDSKQPNPVYKELLGVLIKNNHEARVEKTAPVFFTRWLQYEDRESKSFMN